MSRKKSLTDQNNLKKIGERIKRLRKSLGEKGLSQREFAKTIGISGNYISNLENGLHEPSMPILISIERRYSITADQILTGEGFNPHKNKKYYREKIDLPYLKEIAPDSRSAQPGGQSRTPLDQAINQIKALEEVENRAGVKKLILALADLLVDIDNDHKSMDNVNRTELLWKRLQSTEKDCASLRDEMVLLRQEIKQLRRLLPGLQGATLKKEREDSNL